MQPPPPPDTTMRPALPTVPVLPPARRPVRPDTARWLLWGILVVVALAVLGRVTIPRSGPSVHVFDALFAPPPSYLWTLAIIVAVLSLPLLCSSRLRVWFGAGFLIRPLRFPVPGALAVVVGGLLLLVVAALLDGLWFARAGASETPWSLPAALAFWAILVVMLGFVACRLALAPLKPLRWYSAVVLGWLVLTFSFVPLTGPLGANAAPALLLAARNVSGLLADPAVTTVYRISVNLDLTRANPLFLPFAAIWAGACLAVLRALDNRARVLLTTTALWSAVALLAALGDVSALDRSLNSALLRDPRTWVVVPLFPAALLLVVLSKLALPERACWALAGLLFGILTFGTWGRGTAYFAMALLAAVLLPVGAAAGRWLAHTLADPTAARVRALLFAAILIPCGLGLLDLLWRLAAR